MNQLDVLFESPPQVIACLGNGYDQEFFVSAAGRQDVREYLLEVGKWNMRGTTAEKWQAALAPHGIIVDALHISNYIEVTIRRK